MNNEEYVVAGRLLSCTPFVYRLAKHVRTKVSHSIGFGFQCPLVSVVIFLSTYQPNVNQHRQITLFNLLCFCFLYTVVVTLFNVLYFCSYTLCFCICSAFLRLQYTVLCQTEDINSFIKTISPWSLVTIILRAKLLDMKWIVTINLIRYIFYMTYWASCRMMNLRKTDESIVSTTIIIQYYKF